MPKVVQLETVSIHIYADDHNPPHFHIRGNGVRAVVLVKTLQVTRGRYTPKALAEALAWAAEHMSELEAAWSSYNERD